LVSTHLASTLYVLSLSRLFSHLSVCVFNKSDAELQKKRLKPKLKSRGVRARIREIDMDVEDASMSLRRAKAQATVARDKLHELEERHWALLSLFDADKAFREVEETINEIDQT